MLNEIVDMIWVPTEKFNHLARLLDQPKGQDLVEVPT